MSILAASNPTTGVSADQTIALNGYYASEDYAMHLRRAHFRDQKAGKNLIFHTKQTILPALTICDLYKTRWQAGLF